MKRKHFSFKYLLICVALILVSTCLLSFKASKEFLKEKKNIDSLTILIPDVVVEEFKNDVKNENLELTKISKNEIQKEAKRVLGKKYKLSIIEEDINYGGAFKKLSEKIYNASKRNNGIPCDELVKLIGEKFQTRYAILFTYTSIYNPKYEPYYGIKSSIATNRIELNSYVKPYSDLRLLVIDKKEKTIVYYDVKQSRDIDPRLQGPLKQATKRILKKIYYK